MMQSVKSGNCHASFVDPRALVSKLALISGIRAQRSLLLRHRRLHNPSVVDLLYEEVVRLARVDLKRAARLTRAAAWLAEKLGSDFCRAQSLRAAGHVFLMRGKYEDALHAYEAALLLFRRLKSEAEIGRTLYGGSLQALIYLGQYDRALSWASEARDIFERHGDRLRLARLESNMGNVLYRQDRFEEALKYYRRALEDLKQLGEPQDVAITLRNIAVCYISLADFEQALRTYKAARAHCERHGLAQLVAEADYNIAYLHYQRGEYTRAIELYGATRRHCGKLGDPYHTALCDLDQSEMYLELNLDDEGAQLAAQAASSFRNLGMKYEEAKALAFLAIASSHQGEAEQALRLFNRARRLFMHERNRIWVALIDLYRAVVLYERGSFDRARTLCESAHSVFSVSSLESKALICKLLGARLHLRAGKLASALHECLHVVERLDTREMPALAYQAYFVMGQVQEARRQPKAASAAYEKAHASLENLRSHLRSEELKIAFMRDKLAVYESLVWMRLKDGTSRRDKEAAFVYVEQAKSRSLADQMTFRELDIPARIGEGGELSERVRKLRKALNLCYSRIESMETGRAAPATDRLKSLRQKSKSYEDELVRALVELRGARERLCLIQDAGTVRLDAIRTSLGRDSVLLEYYQARDVLYACVVGQRSLEMIPLGPAAKVRELLQLLQFQLSKFHLNQDYVRCFSAILQAAARANLMNLHRHLVEPVRKWLTAKHVVIVPHGFLHCLPFHALHDGNRYLAGVYCARDRVCS